MELMGIEHPPHEIDVERVIFHHNDGQGRTRWRSLHNQNAFQPYAIREQYGYGCHFNFC